MTNDSRTYNTASCHFAVTRSGYLIVNHWAVDDKAKDNFPEKERGFLEKLLRSNKEFKRPEEDSWDYLSRFFWKGDIKGSRNSSLVYIVRGEIGMQFKIREQILIFEKKLSQFPLIIQPYVTCLDYQGWDKVKGHPLEVGCRIDRPHKVTIASNVKDWNDYADVFRRGVEKPEEK